MIIKYIEGCVSKTLTSSGLAGPCLNGTQQRQLCRLEVDNLQRTSNIHLRSIYITIVSSGLQNTALLRWNRLTMETSASTEAWLHYSLSRCVSYLVACLAPTYLLLPAFPPTNDQLDHNTKGKKKLTSFGSRSFPNQNFAWFPLSCGFCPRDHDIFNLWVMVIYFG